MARFLYAWELGGNLGHVGTFEPVAERLRQAGHDVNFVVRETRSCPMLLGDRFNWVQAPRFDGPPSQSAPLSYADILAGVGHADPDALMGLLVAWRTHWMLAKPDLVFADHAPTAILAARTVGIPVMLFGTGFTAPPPCSPFPAMRNWETTDQDALVARERRLLATINSVLDRLATPPLAHLCALFDVAETALLTLPELDHYRGRPAARYWGLLGRRPAASARASTSPQAPAPAWPAGAGPRIYAYLQHDHALAAAIIAAIGRTTRSAIVYYPDWTDAMTAPQGVTILTQPAPLDRIARDADLAIANGASTVGAFLMAGKPVLSVAIHLEHYLSGLRVAELGAGLVLRADGSVDQIAPALRRLHADRKFADRARAFAAKYASLDHDAVVAAMSARAIALATHR